MFKPRRLFAALTALLLTVSAAHAEEVTVRNKLIRTPHTIWVAEYREGITSGEATRFNGPFKLECDDERTWTKSDASGPYRWVRWAPKDDAFPASYSKDAWNNVANKFKIANGVLTCNITDCTQDGDEIGISDGGLVVNGLVGFLGSAWSAAWSAAWDKVSTAGDPLAVTNETESDQYFCEYQQKPLGKATKLQGGGGGFLVKPGQTKTITKAKLSPGYTERFIYFKQGVNTFGDEGTYDFFIGVKGRKEGCGKAIGKLHIYMNKDSEPRAYNETEWFLKTKMKCLVSNGLAEAVAAVGQVAKIPDWVGEALGIDAILTPIQDTVNGAVEKFVPPDFETTIESLTASVFPDAAVAPIQKARATFVNNMNGIATLFETDAFCNDNPKGSATSILDKLKTWPNLKLNPSWLADSGSFHQGFSSNITLSYKAFSLTFTQTVITDWVNDTKAYNSFGLGISTGCVKQPPEITKSLSMEVYPKIALSGDTSWGWSFGISGEFPGVLDGGATILFDAKAANQAYAPDFSHLGGLSFTADATEATSTAFSFSGGFGMQWPAW